jgi:tetratricopeptide (TPR) repeat protein
MIQYMLSKLEAQARKAVELRTNGNLPAALGAYGLVFEALPFYEELGYGRDTGNIKRLMLEAQPTPALTLYFHALALFHQRKYQSAADAVSAALLSASEIPMVHMLQARILTCLGDLTGALEAAERAQRLDPASVEAREALFVAAAEREMPGEDYYGWLQRFHQWMHPASYVEIGLGHGRSLALPCPETRAVGIDPYQGAWERLNYVCPHGPATLFPLTSDDFFAEHDLREVIGKETFDLAFIDGLHLFEQALKDFINLERYAGKDSVILIHDCLPVAPIVAERERCTGFWTGDVWRIIPCLKTFRPDLRIYTIPTKPSGLAVVTGLDPESTVLKDNFGSISEYYPGLNLPQSTAKRFALLNVLPGNNEEILKTLPKHVNLD